MGSTQSTWGDSEGRDGDCFQLRGQLRVSSSSELLCWPRRRRSRLRWRGRVDFVLRESCNGMSAWQCEVFVYMGSQRKCWRRRNINLPACDVGEWNKESSEFITCLRQD